MRCILLFILFCDILIFSCGYNKTQCSIDIIKKNKWEMIGIKDSSTDESLPSPGYIAAITWLNILSHKTIFDFEDSIVSITDSNGILLGNYDYSVLCDTTLNIYINDEVSVYKTIKISENEIELLGDNNIVIFLKKSSVKQ